MVECLLLEEGDMGMPSGNALYHSHPQGRLGGIWSFRPNALLTLCAPA